MNSRKMSSTEKTFHQSIIDRLTWGFVWQGTCWTNTCLVAQQISGVFSKARESHVGTLSKQILLDLPWKEDIVVEKVDEEHSEDPDVPLEDLLARVLCFICKKAVNPPLA